MGREFTIEERIDRLLSQAQAALARGEFDLARTFREMAEDLQPAPALRLSA